MSQGTVTSHLSSLEQAHRRVLLLSVGALIVFNTSPVFGHHLVKRADALLTGYDHLGGVCLIALHMLLAPVHTMFHLLLLAGLVFAFWDRGRAWLEMSRTLQALDSTSPRLADTARKLESAAGLAPNQIRFVNGLSNPAFTTGFWRPRVFLDAGVVDILDGPQLNAVVAHEAAHVVRRDPLRLSLMRFLACILFYVPALRRLADDLADEAEIDADDSALASSDSLVLASALLALVTWPGDASESNSSHRGSMVMFLPFGSLRRTDLLDRRVRRLAGEPTPAGTHVTRRSITGAGAVLTAVWISGLMMAHPLPSESAGAESLLFQTHARLSHCRHPGSFPFTHLFCLGHHPRPLGAPCPHTGM